MKETPMADQLLHPDATERSQRHPRAFEPLMFVVTVLVSILGTVVGIHMITTLGVSANTAVIGAVIAMLIGRIGFFGLRKMRDINRQNLAQSAISGSTFAAANSLLTPIAVPFAFGRTDLVWPMLVGASIGLLVDVYVLYRAYGSKFLPADAAWPPGVAAAETIKAGDKGLVLRPADVRSRYRDDRKHLGAADVRRRPADQPVLAALPR
jgi:uncharacterized oligopeptide transporter (OPT) family protein